VDASTSDGSNTTDGPIVGDAAAVDASPIDGGQSMDGSSTDCDVSPTFSSIYSSILDQTTGAGSCVIASCHGPFPSGGLQMNMGTDATYTHLLLDSTFDVVARMMYPHRIVPMDPSHSFFYLKISEANPPGSTGQREPEGAPPLSNCRIDAIRTWIEAGAMNN
jgi:hypothetical protein